MLHNLYINILILHLWILTLWSTVTSRCSQDNYKWVCNVAIIFRNQSSCCFKLVCHKINFTAKRFFHLPVFFYRSHKDNLSTIYKLKLSMYSNKSGTIGYEPTFFSFPQKKINVMVHLKTSVMWYLYSLLNQLHNVVSVWWVSQLIYASD